MFIKAFLEGGKQMVEASSDLERLQFMPQKIEDGTIFDFTGRTMFKGLDIKDIEIFDATRVNDAKRITAALKRDYFIALDKVLPLLGHDSDVVDDSDDEAAAIVYGADIYEAIAAGDKKELRAILKEYKKVKWSALDEDDVEDAILDLNDCLVDKDVAGAKEIVNDLIGCDICEDEPEESDAEEVKEEPKKATKKTTTTAAPANEDEAELLADLEEALADEDYEDVEMLLKELGTKHPRYAEFAAKLPGAKVDEPETNDDDSDDDSIIDEICEDIDGAIADGELDEAKEILAELADEAGEDSDVYKEYAAKVNPPKTTRRSRRGK